MKQTCIILYPGSKARKANIIRNYFPAGLDVMASPFLGGAGVEIVTAQKGVRVYGADVYEPLINFWHHALTMPVELARRIERYHPLAKTNYYLIRDSFYSVNDPVENAVRFFVLNRTSFNGIIGGFSKEQRCFNSNAINVLRQFRAPTLQVEVADYRDTLAKHGDKFCYLDPPYSNAKGLYGKSGAHHDDFDHEALADALQHHNNWLMSYCDTPYIRDLYAEYDLIPLRWHYRCPKITRVGFELLIRNCAAPPMQPELFASRPTRSAE